MSDNRLPSRTGPRGYDEGLWDAIKRMVTANPSKDPHGALGGGLLSSLVPLGGIGAGARAGLAGGRAAIGRGTGSLGRWVGGTNRGLPSGLRVEVLGSTRNATSRAGRHIPRGASSQPRAPIAARGTATGGSRQSTPVNIGRNRGTFRQPSGGARGGGPLRPSMMPSGKQVAGATAATVATGAAANRFVDMHNARQQMAQETRARGRGEPPNQTRTQAQPATSFTDELGLGLWAQGQGQGGQQAPQDEFSYQEWLDGQLQQLAGSYDAQIAALGGLSDVYRSNADEAQENIGNFFGYASDVAREGMPVTQEVYDTAQGNVGNIYDNLDSSLQGMPQQLTDIATQAAGGAVSGSVAGRVAEATAPFMAASGTARANAQANLTQHSSAGQSYLNNLASAAPAEGALHQSSVEQALAQQQQLVAFRQAELEGAKQRAMMEMAADISGSSSEQMANQALAQALGLDLPPGVDVNDYVRNKNTLHGMGGNDIKEMRDLIGLQQAEHNLATSQNPGLLFDQAMSQLDRPGQQAFNQLRQQAEVSAGKLSMDGSASPRAVATQMLTEIDKALNPPEGQDPDWEALGLRPGVHSHEAVEQQALQMQEIIRRLLT